MKGEHHGLQKEEGAEEVITLYRILNGVTEAVTVNQSRAGRMIRAGWKVEAPAAPQAEDAAKPAPKKRGRPPKADEK